MSKPELSHEDIQELFRQTRPSKLLLPHDLNHLGSGGIVNALASEQTYLSFILSSVEDYIHKKTEKDDTFRIYTVRKPTVHGKLSFYIDAPLGGNKAEISYKAGSRVEEQISIAEALAVIVIGYVPREKSKKDVSMGFEEVLYLAQLLLELYAVTENGSLLRHKYAIPKNLVAGEIEKIHPHYKSASLPVDLKKKTKAYLVDIFHDYPNVKVTALGCEKKIISDYVEKVKRPPSGEGMNGFKILIGEGDGGFTKPYGALDCFSGERYGVGCFILHIPEDKLKDFLPADRINRKFALSIIRLIVAHEIGHIVCHYQYGNTDNRYVNQRKRTPEMEREAAYFARLLLEHREYLYYGKKDKTFEEARKEWKRLFGYVHGEHGKRGVEWINWVLLD